MSYSNKLSIEIPINEIKVSIIYCKDDNIENFDINQRLKFFSLYLNYLGYVCFYSEKSPNYIEKNSFKGGIIIIFPFFKQEFDLNDLFYNFLSFEEEIISNKIFSNNNILKDIQISFNLYYYFYYLKKKKNTNYFNNFIFIPQSNLTISSYFIKIIPFLSLNFLNIFLYEQENFSSILTFNSKILPKTFILIPPINFPFYVIESIENQIKVFSLNSEKLIFSTYNRPIIILENINSYLKSYFYIKIGKSTRLKSSHNLG